MSVQLFSSLYLPTQPNVMLCSWQDHGSLFLMNFWSLNEQSRNWQCVSSRVLKGTLETSCIVIQRLAAAPCGGRCLERLMREGSLPSVPEGKRWAQVRG